MIKDKINQLLLNSWDSTISGINTEKATEKLTELYLHKEGELALLEEYCESFEYDLSSSTKLLIESLEELKVYKDTQSNNPLKKSKLELLISNIETQIKLNND